MNPLPNILQKIVNRKQIEIAERKAVVPLAEIKAQAALAQPPRGFVAAIQAHIAAPRLAIVAECKKASPSRGVIRKDYDPGAIAVAYEAAGATCLSVITDADFFQGATEHLIAARAACSLPVLRKDFMIDEYQVYEARAMGADCILLIAACLTDRIMQSLCALARALGMDVLVEVHDREELERALMLRTPLIGINNRDLRTFTTDLRTTLDLLVDVFPDRTVITESGILTPEHVALMRRRGVHGFLVGEAFMAASDPGERLKALFFA